MKSFHFFGGRPFATLPIAQIRAKASKWYHASTPNPELWRNLDLIGHVPNSFIELSPVTAKINGDAYHARWKNVRPLGEDVGQYLTKKTQFLPDDDAGEPGTCEA
jgi:hypothetical protein